MSNLLELLSLGPAMPKSPGQVTRVFAALHASMAQSEPDLVAISRSFICKKRQAAAGTCVSGGIRSSRLYGGQGACRRSCCGCSGSDGEDCRQKEARIKEESSSKNSCNVDFRVYIRILSCLTEKTWGPPRGGRQLQHQPSLLSPFSCCASTTAIICSCGQNSLCIVCKYVDMCITCSYIRKACYHA